MTERKQLSDDYAGSISWGTMIPSDIVESIQCFIGGLPEGTLDEDIIQSFKDAFEEFWASLKREDKLIEEMGYQEYMKSDKIEEVYSFVLNEDLWDLMNEIAPEYHYFGASIGDGSDYGFWMCEGVEQVEVEITLPATTTITVRYNRYDENLEDVAIEQVKIDGGIFEEGDYKITGVKPEDETKWMTLEEYEKEGRVL